MSSSFSKCSDYVKLHTETSLISLSLLCATVVLHCSLSLSQSDGNELLETAVLQQIWLELKYGQALFADLMRSVYTVPGLKPILRCARHNRRTKYTSHTFSTLAP